MVINYRLADAELTGAAAAQGAFAPPPVVDDAEAEPPRTRFRSSRASRGKEFVDLDEDLTIADLRNAMQEGFDGELMSATAPCPAWALAEPAVEPVQFRLLAAEHNPALRRHRTGHRAAALPGRHARRARRRLAAQPLRRSALDDNTTRSALWMPAGMASARTAHVVAAARASPKKCAPCGRSAGIIDASRRSRRRDPGSRLRWLLEARATPATSSANAFGTTRYAMTIEAA